MTEWIALGFSGLVLVVAGTTASLTLFRSGALRMTQPTVVFFGPDSGRGEGESPKLKVFLRTLLYSTSRRGQTVESMYVSLQRGESKQNFSIWAYGDDRLARGSGIHVGLEGAACNHNFLLPEDGAAFPHLSGRYTLKVFAKGVADRGSRQLANLALTISESQAAQLERDDADIYLDWGPDQQADQANVEIRRPRPLPPWLLEAASGLPTKE